MINHLDKAYKEIYLHISEDSSGFKIQSGILSDPKIFNPGHAILVSGDKPNLLWDLLHNTIGMPYPQLERKVTPIIKNEKPEEIKPINPLEEELEKLKSWEIIEKVKNEKSVEIICSLKSKKTIIKRALEIYSK